MTAPFGPTMTASSGSTRTIADGLKWPRFRQSTRRKTSSWVGPVQAVMDIPERGVGPTQGVRVGPGGSVLTTRFPRASGRSTGCPDAATADSTTPSTWPRSPRSATGTARAAPATTRKGPKARPAKKPCALKRQISDTIFACLQADAQRAAASANGPGGQPGNDSGPSVAGSHPAYQLFGQATPGPATQPMTPANGQPAPAGLSRQLAVRTGGQSGPGPGGARPRSGARRASLTRPRADNPRGGKAPTPAAKSCRPADTTPHPAHALPLTLKQRGVRYVRRSG
jgi:hypothetical protein